MEEWKTIPDYPDYMVSDIGRVKSLKFGGEKILKQHKDSDGYLMVNLCRNGKQKGFRVHVLMAMAFLGHVPDGGKIEVDHIIEVKIFNRLSNLQLLTREEHRRKTAKNRKDKTSSKYVGVYWSNARQKWCAEITINGKKKHLGYFDCETDAHFVFNSSWTRISKHD